VQYYLFCWDSLRVSSTFYNGAVLRLLEKSMQAKFVRLTSKPSFSNPFLGSSKYVKTLQSVPMYNSYLRLIVSCLFSTFSPQSEHATSALQEKLSNDVECIKLMISDNLSCGIQILTMIIFSLVISFSRGWQLASTVLAMLPVFFMSNMIELYYEATLNTTVTETSETFAMGLFVNIRTSVTMIRFVIQNFVAPTFIIC
jgi:hypothetical protein